MEGAAVVVSWKASFFCFLRRAKSDSSIFHVPIDEARFWGGAGVVFMAERGSPLFVSWQAVNEIIPSPHFQYMLFIVFSPPASFLIIW